MGTLVVGFCYQTERVTWCVCFKERDHSSCMIGMQGNTCAPVTSNKGWKKKTVVSALTTWEREVSVGDSFSFFFFSFFNYVVLFLVLNLDSFRFLFIFCWGGFSSSWKTKTSGRVCWDGWKEGMSLSEWKCWVLVNFVLLLLRVVIIFISSVNLKGEKKIKV